MVRRLLCVSLVLAITSAPAAARPWMCLPPAFDGGQRMHGLPAPRIFWLELLLRQHELCWRQPATADERRVALIGNSAVYGFPLPVEETFGSLVNERFAADGIAARLFNLAFVNPYQVRDALIVREALRYDPDVIVYPMTLAEFVHFAPAVWPALISFFLSNRQPLAEMVADPPPGLQEPFELYGRFLTRHADELSAFAPVREAGAFLRLGVRAQAEAIVTRVHSSRPRFQPRPPQRQTNYDCDKTLEKNEQNYRDWNQWNILAYLQEVQRTRGVQVLIVNWPVAHEPVGDCYNVRYSKAVLTDYVEFLRADTQARGLHYLDLHDLLPPEIFLDSLHVSSEGHRRIAAEIVRALEPILAARRRPAQAATAER